MKWLIVATLFISSCYIVNCKNAEKQTTKKIKHKPTKSPKSILDYFPDLAPEDRTFIKDLDKQFKAHGDKVKIKVERDNSTTAGGKNSKRGVDGETGYAYEQGHYEHGYQFSKPQYVQNNRGYNGPGHRYTNAAYPEIATDIEIQKSKSYEILPEQHEHQTYDSQPVIVLKIPGPTKYAQHLQALLQQYLEVRAAQYLRAFEEEERHQSRYVQQSPVSYYPMVQIAPNVYTHAHHAAQIQPQYYRPTQRYQQQPQQQQYHHQQQQSHQPQQHQTIYHEPSYHQTYYNHFTTNDHRAPKQQVHHYTPVENPVQHQHYAQVKTPQQQPYAQVETPVQQQYEYEETPQAVEPLHHEHHSTEDYTSVTPLKTVENYPSDKHTQVIFKEDKIPYSGEVQSEYGYEDASQLETGSPAPAVVEITQRAPYNYHAHGARGTKRDAPYTEEEFKKYNRIIQKLKRQNSVKIINDKE